MGQPEVWHISDTHFLHERCSVHWRGFSSVTEHDECIISRCRDLIGPRDIVNVHGDCGMSGGEDAILERVARIPGEKHLLLGNHDRPFPGSKGARNHQARWMQVFRSVSLLDWRTIGGRPVMMSHLPYRGDHSPQDRHVRWRPRDEGDWLLCGHVHAEWLISGRQINTGVDWWGFAPVPGRVLEPVVTGREAPGEIFAIREKWLSSAGLPSAVPPKTAAPAGESPMPPLAGAVTGVRLMHGQSSLQDRRSRDDRFRGLGAGRLDIVHAGRCGLLWLRLVGPLGVRLGDGDGRRGGCRVRGGARAADRAAPLSREPLPAV